MLGRTGQRRRIKSGVNTRMSRKEESKWGGVMYSRVFGGVDKEKKKSLAAKADFRRICTSSPILWFDGGRAALAANTLDHSRAGVGGLGGVRGEQNSHSGKRHKTEGETFISSWVCRSRQSKWRTFLTFRSTSK